MSTALNIAASGTVAQVYLALQKLRQSLTEMELFQLDQLKTQIGTLSEVNSATLNGIVLQANEQKWSGYMEGIGLILTGVASVTIALGTHFFVGRAQERQADAIEKGPQTQTITLRNQAEAEATADETQPSHATIEVIQDAASPRAADTATPTTARTQANRAADEAIEKRTLSDDEKKQIDKLREQAQAAKTSAASLYNTFIPSLIQGFFKFFASNHQANATRYGGGAQISQTIASIIQQLQQSFTSFAQYAQSREQTTDSVVTTLIQMSGRA